MQYVNYSMPVIKCKPTLIIYKRLITLKYTNLFDTQFLDNFATHALGPKYIYKF